MEKRNIEKTDKLINLLLINSFIILLSSIIIVFGYIL